MDKHIDCVCIGGSGIKAIINIGILKYYLENNLLNNVNKLIGTSSGTIICILIALNFTASEMYKLFEDNIPNLNKIFIEANSIYDILDHGYISYDTINNLIKEPILKLFGFIPTLKEFYNIVKKDIYFVTFNYNKQETVYVSHRDKNYEDILITDGVKLSCALPIVFKRVTYKNELYLDGWSKDKFPIVYACNISNFVLALNVCHVSTESHTSDDSYMKILKNLFDNISNAYPHQYISLLDKSIQHHVPYKDIYSPNITIKDFKDMYDYGYDTYDKYVYK